MSRNNSNKLRFIQGRQAGVAPPCATLIGSHVTIFFDSVDQSCVFHVLVTDVSRQTGTTAQPQQAAQLNSLIVVGDTSGAIVRMFSAIRCLRFEAAQTSTLFHLIFNSARAGRDVSRASSYHDMTRRCRAEAHFITLLCSCVKEETPI